MEKMMNIENKTVEENENLQAPARYVHEARLLLTYAAQNGLDLDEQLVKEIVGAKTALECNRWNTEIEAKFWLAFNKIAKLVAPVSVDSLKATHVLTDDQSFSRKGGFFNEIAVRFFGKKLRSAAQRSVITYQRGTLIVLAILMLAQFYWIIVSNLTTDISQTLPKKIEALEQERSRLLLQVSPEKMISKDKNQSEVSVEAGVTLDEAPFPPKKPEEVVLLPINQQIQLIDKQIEETKFRLEANYHLLTMWVSSFFINRSQESLRKQANSQKVENQRDILKNTAALQQAKIILQGIQLYILPLLYGLLGAAAYVLRTLTTEIRDLTYEIESNIRYRLRIQLGAVSGLAIGWFSDAGLTFSANTLSLSPLALAFLAGYSVEVLFSLMDRMIYTFSSTENIEKKQRNEKSVSS
jgi:hypothetical protein